MRNFRTLKVWERAHQLTLAIHKVSQRFPADERLGLTSALGRTALLIPSIIAEACGQAENNDMARSLRRAFGAASELEYQLLLAKDLEILPAEMYQDLDAKACELKKLLSGFIATL